MHCEYTFLTYICTMHKQETRTTVHDAGEGASGGVAVVGGPQCQHMLQPVVRHPPPRCLWDPLATTRSLGLLLFRRTTSHMH